MVTTNENTASQHELIVPVTQRLTTWQLCKRWIADKFSCCNPEQDDFDCDSEVRRQIREEMRVSHGYSMDHGPRLLCAMVYNETGYDLCDFEQKELERKERIDKERKKRSRVNEDGTSTSTAIVVWSDKPIPEEDPEEELSELQLAEQLAKTRQETRIIPKFAACMALELRCKLGSLSSDPANLLIVEREYLKLARSINVRRSDIAMHQQFVINTFFTEDELDRIARVRSRLPRWMKWAHDLRVGSTKPIVC